jgi:hypothetical protein
MIQGCGARCLDRSDIRHINTASPCVTLMIMGVLVPDPGKGVCADPMNGGAILGKGGPDPQGGNRERQLSPNKGREKT